MAKTIWKYSLPNPLQEGSTRTIEMPEGAVLLSVAEQHGFIKLWAVVDASRPMVQRHFEVLGTGLDFSDRQRRFIGTVVLREYVWHVFESYPQTNGAKS